MTCFTSCDYITTYALCLWDEFQPFIMNVSKIFVWSASTRKLCTERFVDSLILRLASYCDIYVRNYFAVMFCILYPTIRWISDLIHFYGDVSLIGGCGECFAIQPLSQVATLSWLSLFRSERCRSHVCVSNDSLLKFLNDFKVASCVLRYFCRSKSRFD